MPKDPRIIEIANDKWHSHFMKRASLASEMSKDPSTKVGAVIIGPNREVRSSGYNGMPIGVDDNISERSSNRDLKLMFYEHAERNAIILASRHGTPLEGCTIYINGERGGLPACSDCARAIIQAGIVAVVITLTMEEVPERWKATCDIGLTMLYEAGVKVYRLI